GRVADPTPLTTTEVPSAMALITTAGEDRFAYEGTFVVESAAGRLEIDPARALWASGVTTTRKIDDASVREEVVPIGGTGIVAGRLQRREGGPYLAATGPESLVLFASRADEAPIEALRRLVRFWHGMLALLCGAAVAIAALAAAVLRPW